MRYYGCGVVRCVKCDAMWNVAISDMVRCGMCLKCKMCDVEYHVAWYGLWCPGMWSVA